MDSPNGLLFESRKYFETIRYVHITLAVVTLATGSVSLGLSEDANGTASVPYYFSAFIAGVWQLVFLFLCQVCVYYLSGGPRRSSGASSWVRGYSVMCSVFVLFNVMGVVFAITNGLCFQGQLCYYDKNEAANRGMAILIIVEHCICILFSVFLTKKAHLIDSELEADLSIKLNHHLDFKRMSARSRRTSAVSAITFNSASSIGSCSDMTESVTTSDVGSPNKSPTRFSKHKRSSSYPKKAFIAAKVNSHRDAHQEKAARSRSHPNLRKQPEVIEGTHVSIYSDKDLTQHSNVKKPNPSEMFLASSIKTNNVTQESNKRENNTMLETTNGNVEDIDNTDDVTIADDNNAREEILKQQQMKQQQLLVDQERLQKQQQEVLEQQKQVLLRQQAISYPSNEQPPPYEQLVDTSVNASLVNVKGAADS